MDGIDISLINWSRGQFALTAIYHWLFVPLTLGLSFIIAFMETIYVKTGNEEWKKITKFWMKLFGINFAIGVATGIILEFEFGTNWSNYSWFVGDIFGAPLAIEGIMAFFLEATFIAVMFFGWNIVSKKFHLASTWLVAAGANLSGLWILVANAWMQYPVGMQFNPETARNEMLNFWDVLLSPVAINKFIHTMTSGFVLASIFVIGISSWFLLKKREISLARRSMLISAIFGITSSIVLILSGDSSTRLIADIQPMKLAAIEGLYEGENGTGLILFGTLTKPENYTEENKIWEYNFKIEIPKLLSYMAHRNPDAFVPGMNDLIKGNPEYNIMSAQEKIERGRYARDVLADLKKAKETGNTLKYEELREKFYDTDFKENYFRYFGYSFLNNTGSLIPNVPLSFYSFRIMVMLGFYFFIFFIVILIGVLTAKIDNWRWLLRMAILSIPLSYIASQAGWVVSEMGRQPWVIQDLLPTIIATSHIDASTVQVTFWIFAALFTVLLIAELKIMFRQIKIGPK
jgi:cytochrome d ubiquinol oxidase subunit I